MALLPIRPPSTIHLPEVGASGVPGWLYRFLVAAKRRLESLFIIPNGPTLPFGQNIIGHTLFTADQNYAIPISIEGTRIGTGVQVHNSPDNYTFVLLTNGAPNGPAVYLSLKSNVDAALVSTRTDNTQSYLPLTFAAHGQAALQIASTLSVTSTNLVSPVYILYSGALTQIRYFDDGLGHRILYV